MKSIDPDTISFLVRQENMAIERLVNDLASEAREIVDRLRVGRLHSCHLKSAQSDLDELRYHLTRISAFKETLPSAVSAGDRAPAQ